MRIKFVLAASVVATLPLAAQAAVSDDLVFCSKLTSPRERISCYDAAARIAANAPASIRASVPMVTAPAARHPPPYKAATPERTPFHGSYLSVGGSYAVWAPVNLIASDQVQFFSTNQTPNGPSVVGSLGYNIQLGHFLTGLEFSAR